MRLTIPVQYQATFLERRSRTPRSCYLEGIAYAEVREIPVHDVSTAFLVADTSGLSPGLGPVGGRPRRIILHGGQLWRELMDEASFRALVEEKGTDPEAWAEVRYDNPFAPPDGNSLCWMPELDTTTHEEAARQSAAGIREWNDDGGIGRMQEVQLRANRMLAVGGQVFEACEEPCWTVGMHEGEAVVRLAMYGPEAAAALRKLQDASYWHWQNRLPPAQMFHIGREQDAVLCAREMGTLTEPRARRVRIAAKVRILRPDTAVLADDSLAIEEAAWRAWRVLEKHLPSAPRDAGLAIIALRDALDAGGGRATADLGDAVTGIARHWQPKEAAESQRSEIFGDCAHAFHTRGSGGAKYGSHEAFLGHALESCWVASRRWQRRPPDGREWAHLAATPLFTRSGAAEAREIITLAEARELGGQLGASLDADAAAASEGRLRLIAAMDGVSFTGAATADPDTGRIERMVGRAGRPPSRTASAILESHAATLAAQAGAPRMVR